MDLFDEINEAKSTFLIDITEPQDNKLIINIVETAVSEIEEFIPVGGKYLGPVRAIVVNGNCRKFSLFFRSYVAYIVLNESFAVFHEYEKWIGRIIRVYSESNFLNYVQKATMANEFFDYENEKLKHYSVVCENHVIHIVSVDDPVIAKIN